MSGLQSFPLVVDDDCTVRMKNETSGDWIAKEIENNTPTVERWVTNLNSAQISDDYKLFCLMVVRLAENTFLILIYVNYASLLVKPGLLVLDCNPLEGRGHICIAHLDEW